jgi:hypothetical protein
MGKKLALLPLALLAGSALTGCVAVAIPALAGSAIVGSRVIEDGEPQTATAAPTAPAPAPAPAPIAAPEPAPAPPPPSALTDVPASPPPAAEPPAAERAGFAQFVRYSRNLAISPEAKSGALSAVLSDPVALDGQRRRCAAGEQLVAIIDLDPAGGVFAPPSAPERQQGLVLGLAVLREAGVAITWLSDLSIDESGSLRTALEQSGLDPRGEDIISLRPDGEERKQARRDNLSAASCIIAIAGDERADFDERYKYLRTPEAGAGLEPVIGAGWFLIEPLLVKQGQ